MEMEPDWGALQAEQQALAASVQVPPQQTDFERFASGNILTLDIQYAGDQAHVGLAVQTGLASDIEALGLITEVNFPYRTGFFAYREGPALLEAIRRWEKAFQTEVNLIVIDGHGIAHPRGLGLASWVGLKIDRPTLGIAKRPMAHMDLEVSEEQGALTPLMRDGQIVGHVLRTQTGIKPIYVSPGHLLDIKSAHQLALGLVRNYRIPEPLRMADQHARAMARGEAGPSAILTAVELP